MTVLISPDAKIALLRHELLAKPKSPMLLRRLAEAFAEKGEMQKAAEVFRRSQLLQPFSWIGRPGVDPQNQRDEALGMIKHGAIFSSTIAALAIGEARLGHTEEVQKLVDYDRFFRDVMLEPPSGLTRVDFNAALATEIKSDLTFFGEPKVLATRYAWRNNAIMCSKHPSCIAFTTAIRQEVERYILDLPKSSGHPFLDSCPADFVVDGWAVLSDGASYFESHIHTRAWVSGVYYVAEPSTSQEPGSDRGWLHVGPPEELGVSTEQGWAKRSIAPVAGRLVLMPAYFYHHTRPMGVDEERISIAIDVVPAELAPANPTIADH